MTCDGYGWGMDAVTSNPPPAVNMWVAPTPGDQAPDMGLIAESAAAAGLNPQQVLVAGTNPRGGIAEAWALIGRENGARFLGAWVERCGIPGATVAGFYVDRPGAPLWMGHVVRPPA